MPGDPVAEAYGRGLALLDGEEFFAAHEAFEEAWRTCHPSERDFLQGLVHVAVAWHHARETGRRVACERQLEKAARRLAAYEPAHRDLDVDALLADLEVARGSAFPELPKLRLRRPGTRD